VPTRDQTASESLATPAAKPWRTQPSIAVPVFGNAALLALGAASAGLSGALAMVMLGLLIGGLWHLIFNRPLRGVTWRPRALGAALLGGAFAVMITIGIVSPSATTPAATSLADSSAASPTPTATPTPTALPEDMDDPDGAAVTLATMTPALAPTVDTDAILAQASGQSAAATLTLLTVVEPVGTAAYDRDVFGYRAFDTDRNGCDTRNDILRRDLTATTLKPGTNGCVVLTGTLADPYSGTTTSFQRGASTSADIQIDHVVALSDAWAHGASTWTDDRRHAFGNDPLNLLAVQGPMNQQKSGSNAAAWLPPNASYGCAYVARQIGVKFTYGLSVTAAERAAMVGVLSTCPTEALPAGAAIPPVVTSAAQIAAAAKAATDAQAAAAAQTAAAAAAAAAAAQADTAAAAAAAAAQVADPPPAPAAPDLDPRYGTCKEAIAHGYGPYVRGVNPEYDWYRDGDKDGTNCES
jgi:hypothetical protein